MIIKETDKTLQKIEDMMCYAFPQIEKFPRHERGYSGVATKLKLVMEGMAEHCIDTKKSYYPKSVLKELNELDKCILYARFYTKLAFDLKMFNFKRYEVINDYLDQIGKMTGAWMKTVTEQMK